MGKSGRASPLCSALSGRCEVLSLSEARVDRGLGSVQILATSPVQRKTEDGTGRGVIPSLPNRMSGPYPSLLPESPGTETFIHSFIQSRSHHGVLSASCGSAAS